MKKVSLFGKGFVLGKFAEMYPDEVEVIPRDSVMASSSVFEKLDTDILYGISTIHNYHPKEGNPYIDIKTNLLHFVRVLDENMNSDIVFNLISTWFVYGNSPKIPARESDPCDPKGFYSITARTREQLLISYCETFGFKYRILRLGNVIGVGDNKISLKKNALQYFCKELALGNTITRYKQGGIRDYIDVRDCARAIHLVLEKGEPNQIYNIANGRGLNVKDLIDYAWAASGYKSKIEEIEVPQFHKTVQTPAIYMDISKITKLGYSKQHSIRTTIKELIHYYGHEAEKDSRSLESLHR